MFKAIGNALVLLLFILVLMFAVSLSPYVMPGVAAQIDDILRDDIVSAEKTVDQAREALNAQLAISPDQMREQAVRDLQAQAASESFQNQSLLPLLGLALAIVFTIVMGVVTLIMLKKILSPKQMSDAARQNIVYPTGEAYSANPIHKPLNGKYHAPAPIQHQRKQG